MVRAMMETTRTENTTNNSSELPNLYQIQMDALAKGWLIYPSSINPLTLTIEKRKKTD